MKILRHQQHELSALEIHDLVGIAGAIGFILILWATVSTAFGIPPYLLPSPLDVAKVAFEARARIGIDLLVSGGEALAGFAISCALSFFIALQMSLHRRAERFIFPVLVVIKSFPIVAIAPLIGFWFGYGYAGKVFIAALISFFPLVVNTISGMRDVRQEQIDFFRVMGATRWDEITRLRLPHALPSIFSAMRIAGPLAVVGAVVAEMLGARQGLGYTLSVTSMTLDIPLNFAALFASAVLGMLIFYGIVAVERRVLRRFRLSPKQEW
ncbi:MAG: ABC transporter permease [Fimbriimonadaceae bacterium]